MARLSKYARRVDIDDPAPTRVRWWVQAVAMCFLGLVGVVVGIAGLSRGDVGSFLLGILALAGAAIFFRFGIALVRYLLR